MAHFPLWIRHCTIYTAFAWRLELRIPNRILILQLKLDFPVQTNN